MFHFDGSSWSRRDVDEGTDILAVCPVSSDDAWAGGSSGRVFRWDGNAWHSQDTEIRDPLVDVGVTPSGELWLLSMYDVYRQESSSWVRLDSLPESIYWLSAMQVGAGDDVWITDSGGNIFQWDGESWRQLESGTALGLNGMHSLGEHLWAYGARGTILHRTRD